MPIGCKTVGCALLLLTANGRGAFGASVGAATLISRLGVVDGKDGGKYVGRWWLTGK